MVTYRIATLPGDGIGNEVVPAAQQLLGRAAERFGFAFEWTWFDWGCEYYERWGHMMPEDGLDQLAEHDAIFLGAVGTPRVPDHVSLWGLLIPIRRHFRQYVNLRPIKLLRGIESPLRHLTDDGVDFIVVRENNEGEYSEVGGRMYAGTPEEMAVQESVFTRRGVERTIRYAYELARSRAGRLDSATKSNGIIHTMPFWDQVFAEVGADYPEIATDQHHIDALAAYFVLRPSAFDVVVASNLFGDILTDLGAAVVGGIGIAPSANLNPEREYPSMFEPIHGSAPDIAGRGIANPIGQIWCGAMMLDHLGQTPAADALLGAVEAVLAEGGVRTADLGGDADTTRMTDAIAQAFEDQAAG